MNLEKATAWYREQEQKEKRRKNPFLGVDLENRGFFAEIAVLPEIRSGCWSP